MTDYGEFTREDKEERAERLRKEERERRERERIRVDTEFEQIVMRPTCSENSNLIQFTKHLKIIRTALKAAAADGFCLDEIIGGLKELGDEEDAST